MAILAAMGALVMVGCAESARSGHDGSATRFVSLNPCTDAILVEVADPDQVLALSHYSHDLQASSISPAIAARFPVITGTVEEVAALDPDVVLSSDFIAPATRGALSQLGFRTEAFGIANDVQQSFAQIRRLAALAGHQERGEVLIGRIKAAIVENASPPGSVPISTVLWQPGEIVPGETTLIGALMRQAGFASHSAELGLGQADYLPLEQMISSPPQLLLVAGNSRGQHHPALARLQQTRVEPLDPSLLYCAGPTIIRAAERLGNIRRSML
ncbi:MAG: iron ABC transporter substrate-binding protein [Alphaproteobacteria bacterium]|nr:MAG: iron ABC transporter substrate-binding protein [Alphaproteobacteria bacterium]